jgi:hypothetical protein
VTTVNPGDYLALPLRIQPLPAADVGLLLAGVGTVWLDDVTIEAQNCEPDR